MNDPQQPKAAPTNNQTTDQAIDEILVNLVASETRTMNNATQPSGATTLEFVHVHGLEEGQSVIAIPVHAPWVQLVGKIEGFKLTGIKLPQKIEVGTEFRILSFPVAKATLLTLIAEAETRARIDELEHVYGPDGDDYMWTDIDENDVNLKVLDRLAQLKGEITNEN